MYSEKVHIMNQALAPVYLRPPQALPLRDRQ